MADTTERRRLGPDMRTLLMGAVLAAVSLHHVRHGHPPPRRGRRTAAPRLVGLRGRVRDHRGARVQPRGEGRSARLHPQQRAARRRPLLRQPTRARRRVPARIGAVTLDTARPSTPREARVQPRAHRYRGDGRDRRVPPAARRRIDRRAPVVARGGRRGGRRRRGRVERHLARDALARGTTAARSCSRRRDRHLVVQHEPCAHDRAARAPDPRRERADRRARRRARARRTARTRRCGSATRTSSSSTTSPRPSAGRSERNRFWKRSSNRRASCCAPTSRSSPSSRPMPTVRCSRCVHRATCRSRPRSRRSCSRANGCGPA